MILLPAESESLIVLLIELFKKVKFAESGDLHKFVWNGILGAHIDGTKT